MHYNYSPNLVSTPFNVDKNESSLSANLGGVIYGTNLDIQAAYNPLKRVSLMANYYRAHKKFNESVLVEEQNAFTLHQAEAAAGAWQPLFGEPIYLGGFLGFGMGSVRNDYGYSRIARLHFNKTFFQPTIMYKGEWLRFGFATRLSYLAYKNGKIDSGISAESIESLRKIEQDSPFYLLETGLNIGLYFYGMVVTASIVRSDLGRQSNYDNIYQFDPVNLSAGITFNLNEIFKKKSAKTPVVPATE